MIKKGVVAAGHSLTAEAAITMLRQGGNAFDAVVAAHLAACVVEPVLCSLAGGSFLLGSPSHGKPVVYDFFVQTPKQPKPEKEIDFHPISADFGPAKQEFHIGAGSIATPGVIKGLFEIHKDLCSLPMPILAEPAIRFAREGVRINSFQAYIFKIVGAIYTATPEARRIYVGKNQNNATAEVNELHKQPEMADCLDALSREGEDLFYRGEIGERIIRLCQDNGGHLTRNDLNKYRVIKRRPLEIRYRDSLILTNPPPTSGGLLIAVALKLLESLSLDTCPFGSCDHLGIMTKIQELTNRVRLETLVDKPVLQTAEHLLDPTLLERYKSEISGYPLCSRGTTQISVIDGSGNIASLTTSNGEGCGHMVPGTGIMLNNMLGEEDLNPGGFNRWVTDCRMASMMAPTIAFLPEQAKVATGSGGSNRLRTAILQVLVNLIDFGMSIDDAVIKPRIHYEDGTLNVEPGFDVNELNQLEKLFGNHKYWHEKNLFFGGAHTVAALNNEFYGVGDPRRGGVTLSCP